MTPLRPGLVEEPQHVGVRIGDIGPAWLLRPGWWFRFQQPIEGFVHVAGAPFVHGGQAAVRGSAVVTLNPAMNSGMGR